MIQFPGIDFDFDHSMVYIAGVGFPAVTVGYNICEPVGDSEACRRCASRSPQGGCVSGLESRTDDSSLDRGWEFAVPTENGALVVVEYTQLAPVHGGGMGLIVWLHSRFQHMGVDGGWVSTYLNLLGKRLLRGDPVRCLGSWTWDAVEPDWLAELIQRIAKLPVEPPLPPDDERPVTLIPISDPRVRPKEA